MPPRLTPPPKASWAVLLACGAAVQALAAAPPSELPHPRWDGAVGLLGTYGPEYPGADDLGTALKPAVFVRYGRLSVSSGAGFAVRRDDDLFRGLGLDLTRRQDLRISLGLRYDNGRRERDSAALAGMGDVRKTVRLRAGLQWQPRRAWRVGASWTVDAFGRGGGNLAEVSLAREITLGEGTTLQAGANAALGGRRYMQTYFGVTPAQSVLSGYPVFEPGTGWRDGALFATVKHEFDRHWVMQAGLGVSRVFGGAADSPLARRVTAAGVSGGLAYRF